MVVLCELVWVLSSAYDASQDEITAVLDQILRTRQLRIERRDPVRAALEECKRGAAGFVDCLLGRLNQHAGCEETITFDKDAAAGDGWRELET